MDAISLVLTALKAGAEVVANVTAEEAVKKSYKFLKELVQQKLAGKPQAEMALDEHEKDPETWNKPVSKALTEAGVDQDQGIIQAAQNLMQLIEPKQASERKYNISAEQIIGSAMGDNPRVTTGDINL